MTDKKPPLNPSNLRMPLRRITNFLPPPSPIPPKRYTHQMNGKENSARRTSMTTNTEGLQRPRSRASIAMRPPVQSTTQILKPRRRVSIATLRPEPTSEITTPLRTSTSRFASGSSVSAAIRSQRGRYSNLFAPLPAIRPTSVDTTPISARSSSKFMGSPVHAQGGSRMGRHPTAIALPRRSLVWSPLRLREMKSSHRKSSLLPSKLQ